MISFVKGILEAKTLSSAYVDVSGVGFEVNMPQTSLSMLPEIGSPVMIHTYLHVSDAGFALYGFLSSDEEGLFKSLISVSGIGPKIALAALSTFDAAELSGAIAMQDVSTISKIPGVGKKSAQRIILELKDKISSEGSVAQVVAGSDTSSCDVKPLVRDALLSMGFTDAECKTAFNDAPGDMGESELLQYALKRLGS